MWRSGAGYISFCKMCLLLSGNKKGMNPRDRRRPCSAFSGGTMESRWIVLSAVVALTSGLYSVSAIGAADGGVATLLDTVQSTVGNLPLVGPTLDGAVGEVGGILNSTVIGTVGGLPV